jgi:hypothetical protein
MRVMPLAGSRLVVPLFTLRGEGTLELRWVLDYVGCIDELHIVKASALTHASKRWPRKRVGK